MQRYNSLFIRTWSRINVLERETKLFGEKHTLFSSLILPQVSLGHWLSGRLKDCCISALIVNTYGVCLSLSKSLNLSGPPFSCPNNNETSHYSFSEYFPYIPIWSSQQSCEVCMADTTVLIWLMRKPKLRG